MGKERRAERVVESGGGGFRSTAYRQALLIVGHVLEDVNVFAFFSASRRSSILRLGRAATAVFIILNTPQRGHPTISP